MVIRVKGGTPVGTESLCKTCLYVHMQSGYRECEEVIFCNFATAIRPVLFPVKDCTDYTNRGLPTWEQMEKLALDVQSAPKKKVKGFSVEEPFFGTKTS
jgi:hypothetical protein